MSANSLNRMVKMTNFAEPESSSALERPPAAANIKRFKKEKNRREKSMNENIKNS